MFSASLRSALVALAAAATAVAAVPGLSLKVTGSSAVDGVENLQIVTTVTNTGEETLKLLNDPNGVLSPLPADTFAITSDDGASPSFTGMRVKYSPSQAAKLTDSAACTVLEPGATVSITHDLASAYNFTTVGHGAYSIKASNSFYVVGADNAVSLLSATAEPHSITLTSGDLVVVRRPGAIGKRANFNACSAEQEASLTAAALGAYGYATTAWSYLDYFSTDTPRYSTWFGAFDDTRHGTVLSHFQHMAGNDFTSFSYDCTCTNPSVYAYVYPDQFGAVYLCGAFWNAPLLGTDSQAGTLVHEASHFTVNGGTQDYAYGQSAAQALAQSNPEEAVMNADSHEYFAENNPPQE